MRVDAQTVPQTNLSGRFNTMLYFQRYGLFSFLVALVIIAAVISPPFISLRNIQDLMTQAAPLGMAALGQTFVILTGGLDLSVGSLMSSVAVLATCFAPSNSMMGPIFISAILLGTLIGFANGWLVTKRGVSPFLATFATMIVLRGIRYAWTEGVPMSGDLPPGFRVIGTHLLGGVPINIIALALLTVILGIVLYLTYFGRKLYLVGGNPRAAYLAGINSTTIIILAYIVCSIVASIAGLFLVGYVGSVDNWVGRYYELDSIAAVVMGGASFKGGKGGLFGTLAGVLVLIVIINLVLLLGLPIHFQLIVKGLIIIAATSIYLTKD
jgi:ribose/xylose/arabinose/galactoside ABC-type transport system permease subunit